MKRQIKSHKGSRTARIEARVTVAARNQLTAVLASRHKEISIADWLTEKIQEEFAKVSEKGQPAGADANGLEEEEEQGSTAKGTTPQL